MAKYNYTYHEERGEFHASVEDSNGKTIWEVHYPDFYEDDESGELVESSTIFEDGYMKYQNDIDGLEKYLKSIGVLKANDELVDNDEYAKGGETINIGDRVKFKNNLYSGTFKVVDVGKDASGFKGGYLISNKWIKVGAKRSELIKKNKMEDGGVLSLKDKIRLREIERQIKEEEKTIKEFEEDDTETTYDRFGNPSAPSFNQQVVISAENNLERLQEERKKLLKGKKMADGGMMADGGTLETKLKKRLSESFELPMEMAVYVPSTDKANIIISKRDYTSRIEEVETFLSDLFGGYSAVSVDGGYISDDKGLIQEDVTRVATFGSTENFESKFTKLINKVVDWCNKWGQESMGFEFEGDMFYIDKKASFKHGGEVITK